MGAPRKSGDALLSRPVRRLYSLSLKASFESWIQHSAAKGLGIPGRWLVNLFACVCVCSNDISRGSPPRDRPPDSAVSRHTVIQPLSQVIGDVAPTRLQKHRMGDFGADPGTCSVVDGSFSNPESRSRPSL
jgi:hypothetical protein